LKEFSTLLPKPSGVNIVVVNRIIIQIERIVLFK
jgi:hypothetical protein